MELLSKYLRGFKSIVKFVFPLALLGSLVTPLFGHFSHWTIADEALSHYKNQTAVMIGGSSRSYTATSGKAMRTAEYRERVYILFPSMFSEPKTITISQQDTESYKTSEDPNGAFKVLAIYGLMLFGTWWFWLRKPAKP